MGITILERLSKELPQGRRIRNKSLNVIYELVRRHQGEIEEALARGYSWKQIDEACRISWQEESEKATGIVWWKSKHLVEDSYNALKKGSTQKGKNPLTLEVKVTKR